jgi:uncharacterized protein HemX
MFLYLAESSTCTPRTDAPTTVRITETTHTLPTNSHTTYETNFENPTSTEKVQTGTAAKTKNEKSQVPTTSIVVPVVVVVIGIVVLIAWLVTRKR